MNIQRSQFIEMLRMLAQTAGMERMWWTLTLTDKIQPWDLYDAAREVAVSMFVVRQHDDWVATYIKLCREHTASKVTFLPEPA